ncbi:glycosyltransferase family 4 protein [Thermoflavifilum thermophilum]|uniref:Glycosyltransferase involved in cell wall bisynthesis n=1 Tax=Thermoflavifilum thermophilum TaxID=1393122 RepID=A0A1I7N9M9_9BACT|nr:glycosyltransferase family 4 protein [Thermoflavifilum thermophilum]SFV31367.1 Glycosyltransferase involved in cell wall bisynthesis [Thermoflavifilum thermophilum]
MKPKRVLVIPTSFNVFGAETNMLTLIKALHASDDFQMHIIISGWSNGQFEKELKTAGIFCYSKIKLGWFYITKPTWTLDSLVHLPGAYTQFLKIYRTFKPDVIFTNIYRYLFLLYPFIKCKILYRVQDQLSADWKARWILPRIDRKISRYYVVSDFIRRDLMSIGIDGKKVSVIYNGIDVSENNPHPRNTEKKEIMRLGIVGQIIPRKGHHVLIAALGKLKAAGYATLLEIWGTGDDDYMQQLKKQIQELQLEDAVIWKGYERDRNKIYQSIDVLIAPTTYPQEPFGLIVVEALARGIPVIASNGGGFPEIIEQGKNGFLFDTGNAEELAQCIEQIYLHPDLRKKMGEEGRKKVEQCFTKQKMIHEFFKLLESF